MNKDKLKGKLFFFLVDSKELDTLDEWVEYLDAIVHGPCLILEKDNELQLIENPFITKAQVAIVRGMRVEIYSKEHPPPHFHVLSPTIDASFRIDNCTLLNGEVTKDEHKKIRYWHKQAKPMLIEKWNLMRPTDCVAGLYRE